jgi:hypothetical protein
MHYLYEQEGQASTSTCHCADRWQDYYCYTHCTDHQGELLLYLVYYMVVMPQLAFGFS